MLWLKLWDPYVFKRKVSHRGLTPNEKKLLDIIDTAEDMQRGSNAGQAQSTQGAAGQRMPKHKV